MPSESSDRNLLFGILALQMDFIRRDALIAAMHAWVLDKQKPLGKILLDQNALTIDTHALLDALVQKHLALHRNDAQQSLAAFSSVASVQRDLEQIADADLHASILHLPSSPGRGAGGEVADSTDPYATASSVSAKTPGLRYRVIRPHAKGGLGEVFVAHDEELHREVALKEIQDRHADHPESRSRFLLEAEITGGLEHPGIVPVYGLGQYADGRPYYAMRFIRGDSLQDAIKQFHNPRGESSSPAAPLQFRKLLGRFIDVCQAMQYAHDRGVLHRDLKPGNIMLGKYGETLVVDWGLAKPIGKSAEPEAQVSDSTEPTLRPLSASGSAETVAGTAIGTPNYMSPEQAAGRLDLLGPASDVYCLGATLYCILTGQSPVEDKDVGAVLRKVQTGTIPRPRQVKPGVDPALEAICLKATALKPGDRYATPMLLASEIEKWLADEPVSVWREPITVRARRWTRKHPASVAGVAAAVLVAVVGLSIGAIVLGQKNDQLSAANAQLNTANAGLKRSNENLDAANHTLKATNEKLDLALIAAKNAADAEKLAADKERDATALAVKRLEQIEKANALMEGIFADINPRLAEKGGPLLIEQLRDRLLATADMLDEKAIGEPLAVARLQGFLGNTLNSLGESKKAIELHTKARATRERLLGPDDPATLTSMSNLAEGYRAAGKLELALPLLEETLKLMKAKLGPEHPNTLASMNNLADGYRDAGKVGLALPLFEETLKLMKAKLGPEHPDTLASMNNLALGYRAVGKLEMALPLYEETLKLSKAQLGPEHPDSLTSMNNLALGYRDAGKLDLALPLYEETLKLRKAKLGPDHPDTLTTMGNLAAGYRAAGKLDLALPLYEETLKVRMAKLGREHPDTLTSMNNLAEVYRTAGKLDLALPLFEETLKLTKAKLGLEHPHTLMSMGNLAAGYRAAGQLQLALPLYEETFKLTKAKLGPEHPDTLTSMNNLAVGYRAAGKFDLALPLFDESLKLTKAKLGPEHPHTLMGMNNLAAGYRDAGKPDLALPLFEETLQFRKAKLGLDHPDTLMTMNNLAIVYCEAKASEKAMPLFAEYVDRQRQRMKPGDPKFAAVLLNSAERMQGAGKFADAEKYLRECAGLYQKSASWFKFHVESRLGGALAGQKKYPDAEPLLLKGYEGMKSREKAIPLASKKRLPEAAERLVQLYEATDRKDEAERWRKIVTEHRRQEGKLLDTIHDAGKELKLPGKLDADAPSLIYQVRLKAGVAYTIDMVSPDPKALDPYMFLRDDKGKTLAEDDDSGGGLNARIVFRAPADGVYHIRGATFNNGRGEFTLTVRANE